MGKWYGKIGYIETKETSPGIHKEITTEREYRGETFRNLSGGFQSSGGVNDNINIANGISIVADPFAKEKFCYIRYVEFMGAKWKVTNVEVQHPRLLLTLGGNYNGK